MGPEDGALSVLWVWASARGGMLHVSPAEPIAPSSHSYGGEAAEPSQGDPFTYTGPYLAACNFPLGSFGTGQVGSCLLLLLASLGQ